MSTTTSISQTIVYDHGKRNITTVAFEVPTGTSVVLFTLQTTGSTHGSASFLPHQTGALAPLSGIYVHGGPNPFPNVSVTNHGKLSDVLWEISIQDNLQPTDESRTLHYSVNLLDPDGNHLVFHDPSIVVTPDPPTPEV